jgi:ABC-type Mn2+/Zn2+ transport system permease subunit
MVIDAILLPTAMAVAAGLVGCFAVMRRMALAGDALSHVALPGIGIALALHLNPILGAVAMLLVGGLFVWSIDQRSGVATETLIGVVFSLALAIGSMVTSGPDLVEALFGRSAALAPGEALFGFAAALAIVAFVVRQRHQLIIALVSRDLARTSGIHVRRLDFIYLQLFALTIALGLRYLGVLLMGSLIIIPAATARRLSSNLTQMLTLAALIGAAVTAAGASAALWLHREPGPLIVTIGAAVFLLSLFQKSRGQ